MKRFDRVILAAILGLGLVIGGLSVAAARLGPNVDSFATAMSLDGVSVNTQMAVTFTESMNLQSVQRNFHLSPRIPGDFSWTGNEMFFTPRRRLSFATEYVVTLSTGAVSVSGKHLSHAFHDAFTTQTEHLLYRGAQGREKDRLVLASLSGKRQIVGKDDGLVTDFSTNGDGSLVVYVKRAHSGDRPNELWLLSLVDNSTQRLYSHPDWSISQPHFSPDGKSIVFLATNVLLCQKYYGCYRDTSGPVVYLLELRDYTVRQFSGKSDTPITNFVDFSPAGQVAYTDLGSALTLADPNGNHVIHIPNRGNSLEFAGFDRGGDKAAFVGQTPSSTGGDILVYVHGSYQDISRGVYDSSVPAFSTSGGDVAYAAYRSEHGIEPVYGINVYTFSTRRTTVLTLGRDRQWTDWSPQWSVDDRYIAFVRSAPQEAMYLGSGEIWVVRSSGGSKSEPLGGIGSSPVWVT